MKSYLFIFIGAFVLFSCSKDDPEMVDVEAPTITVSSPSNGSSFAAGADIHFEAAFSDNEALATYNVNIHNNFDGHAHGRLSIAPFTFDQSFDITGKTNDVHEDIAVSSDATAGPYHFIVKAIDQAGNSTQFADGSTKEISIWITNNSMAEVTFYDENMQEVDEYEGVIGEPLAFYGLIEDPNGALEHVIITVGHMEVGEDHDHDHNSRLSEEEPIFEKEYEAEGANSLQIEKLLVNESIIVEQAELDELEDGEHLFIIVTAHDEQGNISKHYKEIHFD